MKTYDTYQEAKIANPECEIFTKAGKFIGECDFGPSPHTCEYRGIAKCNPADHCMTVEKFLADGNRFVEGDVFINTASQVKVVTDDDWASALSLIGSGDDTRYILRAAALEEKKPRTKVEYVKVTDSIFDLRPDFYAGELFSKVNHARDYSAISNTQTLAQALHQKCCYRRIETPMTEREAFIEAACNEVNANLDSDAAEDFGKIFDSGKFKLVN